MQVSAKSVDTTAYRWIVYVKGAKRFVPTNWAFRQGAWFYFGRTTKAKAPRLTDEDLNEIGQTLAFSRELWRFVKVAV